MILRKRDWSSVLSLPEKLMRKSGCPGESANHGEVRRASTPLGTLSPAERNVQAQVGSWASKPGVSWSAVLGGAKSRV